MRFTFYQLLKNYQVTIPLIQRDYAQGRETAGTIRKNFVAKLKQVLTAPVDAPDGDARLHLDFVYGYTENDTFFIPLDGQQRLTTLFLLHWYIAVKEGQFNSGEQDDDAIKSLKALLCNFTYKTRLSSQRFCDKLVGKPIAFTTGSISGKIIDQPWFMSSWKDDPTIQSMLNMLDAIHTGFQTTANIWTRLLSDDAITFEFIDIKSEQFRLTDELYIKMNSRGKPLTNFENFKAEFIDLLKQSDYHEATLPYEGSALSYQDYFSIKIDGKWMDLFWDKRKVIKVDDGMINYLAYITEMLFYNDQPETAVFSFEEAVKTVYSKQENALFLFSSLDILSGLTDTKAFFDGIFSNTGGYVPERVSLFETHSTDLFGRSINGTSFDVRNRILLYALLYYRIAFRDEPLDRLGDFVRIIRNLLTRVRQINSRKRIEFTSNLRLPNFNEYSLFIHGFVQQIKDNPEKSVYEVFRDYNGKGFTKAVLEPEQAKARSILKSSAHKVAIQRLEDHPAVQGISDNFDLDQANVPQLAETFYETWHPEVHNSRIIRGMLTFGDFSIQTHSGSRLGDIWYFGSKDNWGRILTTGVDKEQEYIRPILHNFLVRLTEVQGTATEKLDNLIGSYQEQKDYRYYFIKYNQITSHFYDLFNLYTWGDENGFDINSLGNSGQHPLASYHLNPYLIVLEKELNNDKKVELVYGRFSDAISHLRLKGRAQLYCRHNGWYIQELYKGKITPDLIARYQLNEEGKGYLLRETGQLDRIQIALQFCRDLLQ